MRTLPAATLALGLALAAVPSRADSPLQAPQAPLQRLTSDLKPYLPGNDSAVSAILNIIQLHPQKTDFLNSFTDYLKSERQPGAHPERGERPGWHLGQEVGTTTILNDQQIAALIKVVGDRYDDYAKTLSGTGGVTPNASARPAAPSAAAGLQTNASVPAPKAGTSEGLLTRLAETSDHHDPLFATLTTKASELAASRGDYNSALRGYSSIPQDGTPNAAAQIGMADAAYQMGNYPLARETAAQALKLAPDDRTALSIYHLSDDRIPKAGLKTSPGFDSDAPPPDRLGAGAPASPPPAAREASSGSARAQKSASEAQAAHAALGLGDLPEAVGRAGKALEFDPGNAKALDYRAIAYIRQGRYADAERDAEAALALNPGDLTAREIRLWARGRQGHWSEALSDADALVARAPKSAYAHYSRAFALAGLGDKAAALDELRRAADLDPRFGAKLDEARLLPQDGDMALLFAGEFDSAKPPAPPQRGRLTPVAAAATAGAGLLILMSVLLLFYPRKLETLRRGAFSPARTSAALQGRYEVGDRIGAGGMGVVFDARDLALGRRVALKRIRDEYRLDARQRERFLQEAKTVARMKHPNIVEIYSVFEEKGDMYLVLEFVAGRTLSGLVASKGALGYDEALMLLGPMCGAVEYAHSAQVLHRDLKPANVMVTDAGVVKVMDFGVARRFEDAAGAAVPMTKTVVGTPAYMAPEQEQGAVRRESDTYALAVCFYEMTTGRLPFSGDGSALALNKLAGKVLRAPGERRLPAGFDAAMARALDPDPVRRPRTPAELLAEFRALA